MTGPDRMIWRKAAVLGSIWAASEIVLGSFLHNIRMPFSGELLTGVGIVILVAGHRLWPERGILWRAGLICAFMKSISPSAVIFGPMVAIAMEGLLLETGVRLAGGGRAGYILGGGLAMSWALAHKAANLLIFYGPGAVEVYLRGADWLSRRFGSGPGNYLAPLLALFVPYFLAGAGAASAGLWMRGAAVTAPPPSCSPPPARPRSSTPARQRPYSSAVLLLHVFFSVLILGAGRSIPLPLMAASACLYGVFCAVSYSRVRSLVSHAGFWAGVLIASLSAGYVLGSAEAGAYMALRAFLLTMVFASIGCELMNPSVKGLLRRLGGGILFDTLEYAFASLPGIISGLPSGREFARRPLAVIGGAVARAPFLLDAPRRTGTYILTGGRGSGKSTFIAELARVLRASGRRPGGICAEGILEGGARAGFDLIDLSSGERVPLARRGLRSAAVRAGEFGFYPEGLRAGEAALSARTLEGADVVFLDEIGPLELSGGGWSSALDGLLSSTARPLLLVVRESLLAQVKCRWGLEGAAVWRAGETTAEAAAAALERELKN